MNELELALEELETMDNPTHEVIFDNHLSGTEFSHCDLFETSFYKDFWHNFQTADNSLVNAALEQLVKSFNP
jgi:hypothetical protein